VKARLGALMLESYPGEPPASLAEAYAVQDAAIALWPDVVAGWKVGLVQPQFRAQYGADRIAGPIFRNQVAPARSVAQLPMIPGGFGAVEAEVVIAVGREPPREKIEWTSDEAEAYAGGCFVGIEFAGSPFIGINDFGPAVTASDFGNNAGLVLGRAVEDRRADSLVQIAARVSIEGVEVGGGAASSIPGGPLAAFAFILGHCAARGVALKAGDLISTGAITGVHAVRPGQRVEAEFGRHGKIACRIVQATALAGAAST
jgi:2-keto-4-pentenoate hydratase